MSWGTEGCLGLAVWIGSGYVEARCMLVVGFSLMV